MSAIAHGRSKTIKTREQNRVVASFLEWSGIAGYLRRKKTRNELMSLSDHQLRDIGLNRYEVDLLVREMR